MALIDLDSNDLKLLLDALDDKSGHNAAEVKHIDDVTKKLNVALLGWQLGIDIKALAAMVESQVVTREQALDICARMHIPIDYVMHAKPQTSIIDPFKDR